MLSSGCAEYAAAFFLLGGSLKDAVSVCLKNIGDWQLAVALVRVIEGDDSPILRDILNNTVVPLAFKEGNRYLASWAFWMLRRRDLAVRILVVHHNNFELTIGLAHDVVHTPRCRSKTLRLRSMCRSPRSATLTTTTPVSRCSSPSSSPRRSRPHRARARSQAVPSSTSSSR